MSRRGVRGRLHVSAVSASTATRRREGKPSFVGFRTFTRLRSHRDCGLRGLLGLASHGNSNDSSFPSRQSHLAFLVLECPGMSGSPQTFPQLLLLHAKERPDAVAMRTSDGHTS